MSLKGFAINVPGLQAESGWNILTLLGSGHQKPA